MPGDVVTLALCGDVMLGRGIDQILPHPGDPRLWERHVRDARDYVRLAERMNGPVGRPVDVTWPWGDALPVLHAPDTDVRVVNLETSVTSGGRPSPDKGIHYRMSPANLPCLAAARPDVCALANNHVLDFGPSGLADTVTSLSGAGLTVAGAGGSAHEAWRPAVVPVPAGRVLVVSFGLASSGIPASWAATADRSGVAFAPHPSPDVAEEVVHRLPRADRPGDIVVASVHWGPNWGYRVDPAEAALAHALVDGGVDVVHGHSSHHPRPVEVYRDRLILYGCGDLVNDYEGITGHSQYRPDLRLVCLASLHADSGALATARLVPMRARRMRLWRAPHADSDWLSGVLDRTSRGLGTRFACDRDGTLLAVPA